MASLPPPAIALAALALLLLPLTLPCNAATNCTSHTFSNNKTFSSCTELPHLNASLFWTFHPTNSTASIAFLAPPPKPTGWIAWAINPTSTGMVGSQSLIAFQSSNGSMNVHTYNISAYGPVRPSPISINTSHLEAELEGGVMAIFAMVELPKNGTKWNQVWQVGSSVTGGLPDKHAFDNENLQAKGEWDLLRRESQSGERNSTAPSSSPSPSPSSSPSSTTSQTPAAPSSSESGPGLRGSNWWKGWMVLVFSFGVVLGRI